LGYVTVDSFAILVTDVHFLRESRHWVNYSRSQIIASGSAPFHAGVYIQLDEHVEGQQYPVYAEYQGDTPVRVIVDLSEPTLG